MSFTHSFRLALKSLMTSKMRSLLTMLGIIIGVASVILIISLGDGMNNMINSEFEKMGTNLIQVNLMSPSSSRSVTDDEMYTLAEENTDCITAVSPSACAACTCSRTFSRLPVRVGLITTARTPSSATKAKSGSRRLSSQAMAMPVSRANARESSRFLHGSSRKAMRSR